MPTRTADAVWEGGLKDGRGRIKLSSGAYEGQYSFGSRFENGTGTNPEGAGTGGRLPGRMHGAPLTRTQRRTSTRRGAWADMR